MKVRITKRYKVKVRKRRRRTPPGAGGRGRRDGPEASLFHIRIVALYP